MKRTLEDMLAEPGRHDWRVSNLMQLAVGTWRCVLRGRGGRSFGDTEEAEGRTAEEAVRAALESMHYALRAKPLSAEETRALRVLAATVQRTTQTSAEVLWDQGHPDRRKIAAGL